ncbi:uncharacterized [Tachysurus ichikawai]
MVSFPPSFALIHCSVGEESDFQENEEGSPKAMNQPIVEGVIHRTATEGRLELPSYKSNTNNSLRYLKAL